MKEDIRKQRTHEQQRRCAGIFDADHAGLVRSQKIARHDLQSSSRRAVVAAGIEGDDEGGVPLLVHAEHEVLSDRRFRERNPLFSNAAQDDARIAASVDMLQIGDACRQLNVAVHRGVEQRLLGVEVAQNGGGGDPQLSSDIGERS